METTATETQRQTLLAIHVIETGERDACPRSRVKAVALADWSPEVRAVIEQQRGGIVWQSDGAAWCAAITEFDGELTGCVGLAGLPPLATFAARHSPSPTLKVSIAGALWAGGTERGGDFELAEVVDAAGVIVWSWLEGLEQQKPDTSPSED